MHRITERLEQGMVEVIEAIVCSLGHEMPGDDLVCIMGTRDWGDGWGILRVQIVSGRAYGMNERIRCVKGRA